MNQHHDQTGDGVIRLYAPHDSGAVCRISADTAQYGDPVELILDDRGLFVDVFVRPYLIHHANTCWVAEHQQQVVGYLTGCVDSAGFSRAFRAGLLRTLLRAVTGRYRLGLLTFRAGVGYMRELLARAPEPDLHVYPAHLHINMVQGYRGQGLGRRLMVTFLDQCRDLGVPGVHLSTSDQNTTALHLYEALGFDTLYRYRSPYKSVVSRRPVDTLIMGLRLDDKPV